MLFRPFCGKHVPRVHASAPEVTLRKFHFAAATSIRPLCLLKWEEQQNETLRKDVDRNEWIRDHLRAGHFRPGFSRL
jgi:hypothetical protein